MSNFIIILFCLFAGYCLRRFHVIRPDGVKAINSWIIYVGLPATSFKYLPELQWSQQLLSALWSPLFIFFCSLLLFKLIAIPLGLSQRTSRTLILVAGLSNTSFVGFPLVMTYFGEEQLKWAIICDQMTFFILSSLGTLVALGKSTGQVQNKKILYRYMLKKVCSFPPLIGCVAALLLSKVLDLTPLKPFFTQLSSTVSPLALFSIGTQLSFSLYRSEWFLIRIALLYKLLIGPFVLLLIFCFLKQEGEVVQVVNFEMAMPCLVATSMSLQQFNLNTKLGNAIIGSSILIGLFSTWLFYQLIIAFL
ncbi:AEC family transporter [Sphingobacterium sp. LRF_L2]|uniref:AEC family transporter n=1 Tax=Sphingobacterium sp. LRF_L2 TaxID=3369421 RepID=UPI003F5F885E